MSDVISFRLSEINPREAQAREVIEAWVKQGYSLRYILTEALLLLGKQSPDNLKTSDISDSVTRLSLLIERLEDRVVKDQPIRAEKSELSETFVSSIKMAIKPGLGIKE